MVGRYLLGVSSFCTKYKTTRPVGQNLGGAVASSAFSGRLLYSIRTCNVQNTVVMEIDNYSHQNCNSSPSAWFSETNV